MLRDRANRRQTQAFAPGTRVNHISHLRIFHLFTVFCDLQAFPVDVYRVPDPLFHVAEVSVQRHGLGEATS